MTRRARIARSLEDLNPVGLIALVVMIFTVAMIVLITRPLWGSLSPRTVAATTPRDPGKAERDFETAADQHLARVEGRSLFAIPQPPRADAAQDRGPKPTVYGGPALLAFVNGAAWFADGQRLSTAEPKGKSLRLVKADPPWSVRVEWEGAEFDVELFKRTTLSTLAETRSVPLSSIPTRSGSGGRSSSGSRPAASSSNSGSSAAAGAPAQFQSAGGAPIGPGGPGGNGGGGGGGPPPGAPGAPPPPPDVAGTRPPGGEPGSQPAAPPGQTPASSPSPSPAPAPSDTPPDSPSAPPANPPGNPETLR